ncbi:secreted RxLR effector protein 78-like [Capsicum annuum]|uniref:secreted RxLR effector protein 78-like n=1 Tax=Capsicum annuum TaxID=4072 RepID=UPI001FB19FB3|nr:secreted RxLR effector protein 78-like [Capsicum annuum]
MVDEHQMAFLRGRKMMDASLLPNELVDSRVKQKKPGILCKLDIEKAYDHVNWNFLLKILEDTGFSSTWISWIRFCISNVKCSLIINGKAEGFFQSYRGLRQGDPMPPFLFLIALEDLNHMFRKAKANSWTKGFSPKLEREKS